VRRRRRRRDAAWAAAVAVGGADADDDGEARRIWRREASGGLRIGSAAPGRRPAAAAPSRRRCCTLRQSQTQRRCGTGGVPPRCRRAAIASIGAVRARHGGSERTSAPRAPHAARSRAQHAAAPPAPQRHPADAGVSRVSGVGPALSTMPYGARSPLPAAPAAGARLGAARHAAQRAWLASTQKAARGSQPVRGCAWRARGTEGGMRRSPRLLAAGCRLAAAVSSEQTSQHAYQ
jgi:hypothetical protein